MTINYNSEIHSFIKSAKEYCQLIDKHEEYNLPEFLKELSKAMSVLYSAALSLPEIPVSDFETEKSTSSKLHKDLYTMLRKYLEPYNAYVSKFGPIDINDKTLVEAELADDICDIYRDLSDYLYVFDGNDIQTQQDALWQMQFSFGSHWGRHLVSAQSVIHNILFSHYY